MEKEDKQFQVIGSLGNILTLLTTLIRKGTNSNTWNCFLTEKDTSALKLWLQLEDNCKLFQFV